MGCDGTHGGTHGGRTVDGVAALFDRVAATYDSGGVEFFAHFGRRLVALAGVAPGHRVLDVGAGRGAVLFPAARVAGAGGHVTGIDLAPQMVGLTAETIHNEGVTNAEMLLGDAAAPAFPSATFDVVLGGLVACFLPCPLRAFHAYHRLLRPGGRLGLSTFDDAGADYGFLTALLERFGDDDAQVADPTEPAVTGPDLLDAALATAGFDELHVTTEEHVAVFRDHDHWWDWQWSHGQRRLLEAVPDRAAAAFRRAAYDELERLRRPDGSFAVRCVVRYTVARRAPVPAEGDAMRPCAAA